ncbi:MAG TPA: hypothetical protein VMW48_13420, partial [Vicinamibacterales bacterium]|nr:hypothetical protein [Vicinamibacterales bacterium]
ESAFIPSPSYALHVEAAADTEPPLTFSKLLADRYAGLPEDSMRPAMVVRRCGAGSAVYFACDLGAALNAWCLAAHLRIVRNLVEHFAPPAVRIPEAPPSLEVSLRGSADGRDVLLHLVNYTGGMTRPMQRVVPLHGLAVELRVAQRIGSVRAVWAKRSVKFSQIGDVVRFALPTVHECEIIRFRLHA